MRQKGVKRLICAPSNKDKDRQEQVVRDSGLDWTLVRPGRLTNGPVTGRYQDWTDLTGNRPGAISMADVAHFLLKEGREDRYVRQAVNLTD